MNVGSSGGSRRVPPPSRPTPGAPGLSDTPIVAARVGAERLTDAAGALPGASQADAMDATPVQAPDSPGPTPLSPRASIIFGAGAHAVSDVAVTLNYDVGQRSITEEPRQYPMQSLGGGRWRFEFDLPSGPEVIQLNWDVRGTLPDGRVESLVTETCVPITTVFKDGAEARRGFGMQERMGFWRDGQDENDACFRFWHPDVTDVQLRLRAPSGEERLEHMVREPGGFWSTRLAGGYPALRGWTYQPIVTSAESVVATLDEHARYTSGGGRGLSLHYFDARPGRGEEVNQYGDNAWGEQRVPMATLMRFEIPNVAVGREAFLVLRNANDEPLSADDIRSRFGYLDPQLKSDILRHRQGHNEIALDHLEDDGRIRLSQRGRSFGTFVHNSAALHGLRYELQLWVDGKDGALTLKHGAPGAKYLTPAQRRSDPCNDPYDDLLSWQSGLFNRAGVVEDQPYIWLNPRPDAEKAVALRHGIALQVHVGAALSDEQNSVFSTFGDLRSDAYLDSLVADGVRRVMLMPDIFAQNGRARDRGYDFPQNAAVRTTYGWATSEVRVGKNGIPVARRARWVSSRNALKGFVDRCHRRGIEVFMDWVPGHGMHNEALWGRGGPDGGVFFSNVDTMFGRAPAHDRPEVLDFEIHWVTEMLREFNFDGVRCDMVSDVVSTPGGTEMLKRFNRQVHLLFPSVKTIAETYADKWPPIPSVLAPADRNPQSASLGFDELWDNRVRQALVRAHSGEDRGVLHRAAAGLPIDFSHLKYLLIEYPGASSWTQILHQVGNVDENEHTGPLAEVADGNQRLIFPSDRGRARTRAAYALQLLMPGHVLLHQGDQHMATHYPSHNIPSTWDDGHAFRSDTKDWDVDAISVHDNDRKLYWELSNLDQSTRERRDDYTRLSDETRRFVAHQATLSERDRHDLTLSVSRAQFSAMHQAILELRRAPGFSPETPALHVDESGSAISWVRESLEDAFWVVGSLADGPQAAVNLWLPPGRWEACFSTDDPGFGGIGVAANPRVLEGGRRVALSMPSAATVVFKRTSSETA
ncbi:MAG: hypothetical protein ACKVPX_05400 [Myxococcaceae bacterium]